ncbi:hypothetical protein FSARC_8301 [Fusarium sarcochroum]|uniref:Tail specific protease domain-containing protein n=1 Tax=Fusarium sarcochroum TaxID=1208366 RepID=A0A8H4TTM1_9HYPO|nr:hypothetical protein FSARC_8301 [Fusarium sarcochroum]
MRLSVFEICGAALLLPDYVVGKPSLDVSSIIPTSTTSSLHIGNSAIACSAVSSLWAAQIETTPTPTVNAKLAYDCLNSVPLNKPAALRFMAELEPYVEWQSTLAFLKEPPTDYFFPPHDVSAALNSLRTRLEADKYLNEYEWQEDLYVNVFGPAHDGHFYVFPDVLTNAVEWERPLALVSISNNGSSPPVVKVYDDVISLPGIAPAVSLINGVDATDFIEETVFRVTGYHDADAAYNSMFYTKAVASSNGTGYFKQGGRTRYVYPGAFTSATFENGSSIEIPNVARLKGNWTGIINGQTFLDKFAPYATTTDAIPVATTNKVKGSTTKSSAVPTASAAIAGYPEPVIISSDSTVSGYFIDQPGFDDVAVLVLRSFGPKTPAEYQDTVQRFFATAVHAGKTTLVIDVQNNAGGYVLQGYDTFRQIFPDIVPEDTAQWRYSPAFKATSEIISKNCEDYDPNTASDALIEQCESVYNWRYGLDRNLEGFGSYKHKFPPVVHKGDEYTELVQTNFSNPLDTINSTYGLGFNVTGYGSRNNFTRPFGGPENIVLLHDGGCASTCALFARAMKWDAGVKSIAMGGRPRIKGRIQGVGGVKGAQMYSFNSVYGFTQLAKRATNHTALIAQLDRFTPYVSKRSSATGVNVKNGILHGNWKDGTPAQFVTEYSDCRLYWQADMHRDITNLWKAAANVAFKGGKCAFGAVDYQSELSSTNKHVNARSASSPEDGIWSSTYQAVQPAWAAERIAKSWMFKANHYMRTEN